MKLTFMRLAARTAGVARIPLDRTSKRLGRAAWRLYCRRHNWSYRGDVDDVFIVSYPKSGTTLVQVLVHQLTTDGQWNFEHIDTFSPTVESCWAREIRLDMLPRRRVLKSHLTYAHIPKGPGRYIYVVRNGLDVAVSFYHHAKRRLNETRPFDAFFHDFVAGRLPGGLWFAHVADWHRNRRGLHVLYVTYEDLTSDLRMVAERVADFIGITVAADQWPRILANCSFATMRGYEHKLDPMTIRRRTLADGDPTPSPTPTDGASLPDELARGYAAALRRHALPPDWCEAGR